MKFPEIIAPSIAKVPLDAIGWQIMRDGEPECDGLGSPTVEQTCSPKVGKILGMEIAKNSPEVPVQTMQVHSKQATNCRTRGLRWRLRVHI